MLTRQSTGRSIFCKLAMMIYNDTTQAWPTCDPFQKECNGGKFPKVNIVKRHEWACFNAHKRAQVGYGGISFEDQVKVKLGYIQVNKQIEVQFHNKWAQVKFAHVKNLCLNQKIDLAFWGSSSMSTNNGSGHDSPTNQALSHRE